MSESMACDPAHRLDEYGPEPLYIARQDLFTDTDDPIHQAPEVVADALECHMKSTPPAPSPGFFR